jgi:hypothetical protein
MRITCTSKRLVARFAVAVLVFSPPAARLAAAQAQNQPISQLQERVAEVKESAAKNKQALSQYSWQQKQTISVKGEVKDTKTFQVRLGPDGKPQKTEVGNLPQSGGGEQGPGRRVKEKKAEEYKEYGQQIAALAQQYAQPNPEKLQQAYEQGNLELASDGGPAGQVQMVIKNYVKPNDKVTLTFNQQAKAIQSLHILSYLNDPKDAVAIDAQYSQLPDGTNHVSGMQINGTSKGLVVTTQNSDYKKSTM